LKKKTNLTTQRDSTVVVLGVSKIQWDFSWTKRRTKKAKKRKLQINCFEHERFRLK
jgi:hypothetical protein